MAGNITVPDLEPLTPFGNALAGALGGVFSNAVIYPLDTWVSPGVANHQTFC